MIAERIEAVRRVDWRPFTRITSTVVVLGLAAHQFLGWQPPLRRLPARPGQILGVLSLMAMISFALADLYLLVFLVPLYVVGVLNDWFYDLSRWLCRVVLRMMPGPLLALSALCGEIVLFGGLEAVIRRLLVGL